MRFELFIATRYLRAKRRQAVIGVITGISIAGVAAGVASLVVALAINNGFREDLQNRLLGSTSHINILRLESDGIKDWRPLMDKLAKQPHIVAAAPAIYEQVLISRGPRARGAVLKGMIPAYESKVSDLLGTVKIGSMDPLAEGAVQPGLRTGSDGKAGSSVGTSGSGTTSNSGNSPDAMNSVHDRVASMPPIVLGKDIAEDLGATLNSIVLVTSPQGELTPFGLVPKYIRFRVVGIFNSGFFDYDSSWAFTRLVDTQQLKVWVIRLRCSSSRWMTFTRRARFRNSWNRPLATAPPGGRGRADLAGGHRLQPLYLAGGRRARRAARPFAPAPGPGRRPGRHLCAHVPGPAAARPHAAQAGPPFARACWPPPSMPRRWRHRRPESHDDWVRSAALAEILAAVPHPALRALWDFGNAFAAGEDPAEGLRVLGPRLGYVHVKDGVLAPDGNWRLTQLGQGQVPLRRVIEGLLALDYTGALTVEWERAWHPELEPAETALPAALRVLRQLLAEAQQAKEKTTP